MDTGLPNYVTKSAIRLTIKSLNRSQTSKHAPLAVRNRSTSYGETKSHILVALVGNKATGMHPGPIPELRAALGVSLSIFVLRALLCLLVNTVLAVEVRMEECVFVGTDCMEY